jgi:hypothetical protein
LPSPANLPDGWSRSPIDRFVFAKLAESHLAPSPPADPRDFVRRITFDLTGLPPTPQEVEDFVSAVAKDGYDAAVAAVADRLLASPRYGERWGRHWLDVVRFGESNGFERNVTRDDAWPFRDYVIRSINDDKPFDRFIMEHLAGDRLAPGDPDVEVGTGFLVAGPYDDVGNQDAKAAAQIRANTLDDIVTATGSAFLGLTINCARCHDHKFDPIPQADYYRVQAALAGVQQGSREWATKQQREELAAKRAPIEAQIVALTRKIEAVKATPAGTAGVAGSEAEGMDRLAGTERQLAPLKRQLSALPRLPTAWLGTFRQPERSYLMQGGDPQKHGPNIAPASLAVLGLVTTKYELPVDAPEGDRRLALAKWLVADDNPLTPRVLANRVWHYHFGTGIVDTPSDFGVMGGRPTHPELLDWLALELERGGWRLKSLHRQIVTSQAYRQSSAARSEAAPVDKDARLLWRFPPRRLSAEEVRDAMLFVAGKLDLRMGGPGFRLYEYQNDNVSTYIPLDHPSPQTYRRAIYHQNARASVVDVLSDFDQPDCAFTTPRRAATTTPMQALTMLNHPFTLDMANALADRVRRDMGDDPAKQVDRAFRLAFGRAPEATELEAAKRFVAENDLPALARAIFNSNEMVYVR